MEFDLIPYTGMLYVVARSARKAREIPVQAAPHAEARRDVAVFRPAFVASVAYIDPGNFASNFEGGARFGYTLLWVLLWSNAMAILIQYLSAKLGIATGKTLPQNCRGVFFSQANFGLWVAAELAALATDLAEFLGAAPGILPAAWHPPGDFPAALITAVVVFLMLAVELYGFRRLEQLIMVFVFAIAGLLRL